MDFILLILIGIVGGISTYGIIGLWNYLYNKEN